jgi:hypothetical protein
LEVAASLLCVSFFLCTSLTHLALPGMADAPLSSHGRSEQVATAEQQEQHHHDEPHLEQPEQQHDEEFDPDTEQLEGAAFDVVDDDQAGGGVFEEEEAAAALCGVSLRDVAAAVALIRVVASPPFPSDLLTRSAHPALKAVRSAFRSLAPLLDPAYEGQTFHEHKTKRQRKYVLPCLTSCRLTDSVALRCVDALAGENMRVASSNNALWIESAWNQRNCVRMWYTLVA